MSTVLEVDDNGSLRVPAGVLPNAKPRTRYLAIAEGAQVVLSPEAATQEPVWNRTAQDWAEHLRQWADRHKDGPGLSDYAASRDSIYD